ncbi:peptidoglycan-binding domain-containing protein [Nannocystaceae bacterium ST9]
MPTHRVEQGQTIAHVAWQHGVGMRAILDAPENRELFARRSMNILFEGDEVFVPDEPAKQVGIETGRSHLFIYQPRTIPVRLQFLQAGVPRSHEPVDWRVAGGELVEDRLDAEGWLRAAVPLDASELEVVFQPGTDYAKTTTMRLAHLDPVEEVRGIQQRLNNLGFACGAESGDAGDETRAAIEAYQRAHGLAETGEIDDSTRAHLGGRHRC